MAGLSSSCPDGSCWVSSVNRQTKPAMRGPGSLRSLAPAPGNCGPARLLDDPAALALVHRAGVVAFHRPRLADHFAVQFHGAAAFGDVEALHRVDLREGFLAAAARDVEAGMGRISGELALAGPGPAVGAGLVGSILADRSHFEHRRGTVGSDAAGAPAVFFDLDGPLFVGAELALLGLLDGARVVVDFDLQRVDLGLVICLRRRRAENGAEQ